MKLSGIYKIKSKIKPNKIYIGSSINIKNRWWLHLNSLKKNKHGNSKLQNHFNKYGIADLEFSILLTCEKEDLIKIEQYFIDCYKPWFNISPTAYSLLGIKRSEETKKKMSLRMKGRKLSDETRLKMAKRMMGNKYRLGLRPPPSAYEKIKKYNKGKKFSEQSRLKMSEAQKGIKKSEESNRKRSLSLIEYRKMNPRLPITEGTREKMRISHLGKKPWNKGIKKIA